MRYMFIIKHCQIDSMLYICSAIDHRRCKNLHVLGYCLLCHFLLLPHFDIICDVYLLNWRTQNYSWPYNNYYCVKRMFSRCHLIIIDSMLIEKIWFKSFNLDYICSTKYADVNTALKVEKFVIDVNIYRQ